MHKSQSNFWLFPHLMRLHKPYLNDISFPIVLYDKLMTFVQIETIKIGKTTGNMLMFRPNCVILAPLFLLSCVDHLLYSLMAHIIYLSLFHDLLYLSLSSQLTINPKCLNNLIDITDLNRKFPSNFLFEWICDCSEPIHMIFPFSIIQSDFLFISIKYWTNKTEQQSNTHINSGLKIYIWIGIKYHLNYW